LSLKLDKLLYRLNTMELLRLAKKRQKYHELAKILGISGSTICRYVVGDVLPTYERCEEIRRSLIRGGWDFRSILIDLIERQVGGTFDITPLLFLPQARALIAFWVFDKFSRLMIKKVLTPAVDGIPVATSISDMFRRPLVIAKTYKESGVERFHVVDVRREDGGIVTWYVPYHSLRKGDRVLIVDDVIRTGVTQNAIIKLCGEAGADPVGIFAIVGVGDWDRRIEAPPKTVKKVLIRMRV